MKTGEKIKKIIYISHWRFPAEKTHASFAMKTCESFAKLGIGVEIWAPRRRNAALASENPFIYHNVVENFKIKRLPCLDIMGLLPGNLPFYLLVVSFNISLFFAVFWERADSRTIFYFHDARDAILLSFLRCRMFLEIHDFYRSNLDFINRMVFRKITGFIVTNKIKVEILRDSYGIEEKRLLCQPNAVDIEKFSLTMSQSDAREKLSLPVDKKIILYTGQLHGWKGVDTLLLAAKYILDDQIIYFVGGNGQEMVDFYERARSLNLDEKVKIIGRQPHKEMPMWQKAADVLVIPNTGKDFASKYETSPMKLFEYMASSVPIVASDLPSVRCVVDDTMVWFFEADNPSSLNAAVQNALIKEDESERRALGAFADVKKYDWLIRAERIKEFLLNFC